MRTTFRLETDSAKTPVFSPVFLKKVRLLLSLLIAAAVTPGCQKSEDEAVAQSPTPTSQNAASNSQTNTSNNYVLGTVIQFGMGGGSERFKRGGWSSTENQHTWTTGESAKLVFSLPANTEPLTFRMRLTGLIKPPQLTVQSVTVLANGQKIAEWQVGIGADFTATIPAQLIKDGSPLTIELKTPNATSPKSLGTSDDARVLGVLCSEIEISKGG